MAGFPKRENKTGEKAWKPIPGIALEKQIPLEHFEKLIIQHRGNLSRVAEAVGSTRHTLLDVCNRNPSLRTALDDQRARWIDDVEQSVLTKAANEGADTALQCFVLKTQGRHRGWDQDDVKNAAKDIAHAAFEFIVNKSKNPAES